MTTLWIDIHPWTYQNLSFVKWVDLKILCRHRREGVISLWLPLLLYTKTKSKNNSLGPILLKHTYIQNINDTTSIVIFEDRNFIRDVTRQSTL